MEKREKLGSRLGFILLSAGCAIGIGNVWKFPYITGQYGGGIFVLIYLLFLVIMGVPVMSMEFSMGRGAQASPVKMYDKLTDKPKRWRWHGYAALVGNFLLMMFYTSVCGWMFQYFFYMLTGKFDSIEKTPEAVAGVYENMLAQPWVLLIFLAIVVVLGFIICSFDMQKGLEKVTKYMMLALLALIVILAINSCLLDGAGEGLKFYLVPSFDRMQEAGIFNIIVAAMNQSFFTLSLGIGSMAIFGSFIGRERSLLGESLNIAVLDTFVAVVSGLIIFPACFSFGITPDAGPSLIFITLPRVFMEMTGGRIWGTLFFIFMSFASFSTILAVFQNIISCVSELFGWGKRKTCLICGVAMFFLSLPCLFGFNLIPSLDFIKEGWVILDLEDYLVSNILLPLGALTMILFCTHRFGWGFKNYQKEANMGKGLKVGNWMRIYCAYILPAIIGALLIYGIISPFI